MKKRGRPLALGPVAVLFGIWSVIAPLGLGAAVAIAIPRLAEWPWAIAALPQIVGGIGVITLLLSAALLARLPRVDAAVAGRARFIFGALLGLIAGPSQIALAIVLWVITSGRGLAPLGLPIDVLMEGGASILLSGLESAALEHGLWETLWTLGAVQLAFWPVSLLIALSGWFLIDERIRRVLWWIVDVPLAGAFFFALWALPLGPPAEGEDPTLSAIGLAIVTLASLRIFGRALPVVLDVIERMGFQALVAARMLRARKSGFLTAIGLLSILAVSFSSCTLTTTLSVMGGFREDLLRKILGNNAHVVIDREYGNFEGWAPLIETTRAQPGVQGVSPFVAGEVMVSSVSNIGGAVLRGIDPRTVGEVTDLPRNMRMGRIEYLLEPEQLLHLSIEEMTGSVLFPSRPPPPPPPPPSAPPDGNAADAGPRSRTDVLLDEVDRALARLPTLSEHEERALTATPELDTEALADLDPPTAEWPDDLRVFGDPDGLFVSPTRPRRPREVLPGLIVGQELARNLRLHVGDEVNIVSPRGDIGPSGPIPRSRPFRIAGIFYSGMYEYDNNMIYTDLESAQRFLSAGDAVTGIEVRIEDWEDAEASARGIEQALGRSELRARSWQEVNRNLFGALALEKLAMFITLGIAILVASFCVIGTLVLMVQEKGREVAILKAMGAEDRHIVGVFMMQGLLIGLLGASTGLGLGWIVCYVAEQYPIIPLDPDVYYIDRLPIHTEPMEFVAVGLSAVVVCLLATIYPAILGSRLRPVEALRYA